jgi:hypothetical protein
VSLVIPPTTLDVNTALGIVACRRVAVWVARGHSLVRRLGSGGGGGSGGSGLNLSFCFFVLSIDRLWLLRCLVLGKVLYATGSSRSDGLGVEAAI